MNAGSTSGPYQNRIHVQIHDSLYKYQLQTNTNTFTNAHKYIFPNSVETVMAQISKQS